MKIIYISPVFDDDIYHRVFKRDRKPGIASAKFHSLILDGLSRNEIEIHSYSILPADRNTCDKVRIHISSTRKENLKTEYIAFLNIPKLKNIQILFKIFWKTLFLSGEHIIIYDLWCPAAALGAIVSAKIGHKKTVAIVTDLPRFSNTVNRIESKVFDKMLKQTDSYIFLTELMNTEINPTGKPYMILEGISDFSMQSKIKDAKKPDKKIVLYAGTVSSMYGLDILCESFMRCSLSDEELHIYGDGDYKEKLLELSRNNPRIVYHGVHINSEIVEAEMGATLLVNPRSGKDEYTKYSFPSKTMEYMASGTPVLSAKLPGIPDEYDPYLFYFDDCVENGLEKALREILDMSFTALEEKGRKAREFVLTQKNNVVQARKVLKFFKKEVLCE